MADRKTVILVAGMHRSGTSAVSGALSAAGVNFGDQLIPAVEGVNDRGFFEDRDILRIHDQLLADFGTDWRELHRLPDGWQTGSHAKKAAEALTERLADWPGELIGIKDPRLCLLLPLWQEILQKLSFSAVCLQVLRHPDHVAASLFRRDQIQRAEALYLWFCHNIQMERYSRPFRRTLLAYDRVLEAPVETLSAAAEQLGIALPDPESMLMAISRELSHAAGHHRAEPPPKMVVKLYAALLKGADAAELDSLYDQWHGDESLLLPILRADRRALAEFNAGMSQAMETVQVYRQHFENAEQKLQELGDGISEAAKTVEAYRQQVEDSEKRQQELGSGLSRAMETIQAQEEHRHRLEQQRRFSRSIWGAASGEEGAQKACGPVHVDIHLENNSQARMLRLLRDRQPGSVLDVGCATGESGALAKTFGHEVWGVEMSAAAAAVAGQKLDRIYTGTIEGFLADYPDERFDIILFGNVLDQLLSPAEVLSACTRLLSPGGVIIGSVMNAGHSSVRLPWLAGQSGPSGRLHFFTRNDTLDLLTAADLSVNCFDDVVQPTAPGENIHDPRLAAVMEMSLLPLLRGRDLDAVQFVFQAVHVPDAPVSSLNERFRSNNYPRILCLLPAPGHSLAKIRVEQPLGFWRSRHGGEFRIAGMAEPDPHDLDWCTHVLLQRETGPSELNLIARLQTLGKLVLFEIDDLLTEVPPFLGVYEHAGMQRPWLVASLARVDAVITSTGPLQKAMQSYNKRVFLVPNCTSTNFAPARHTDGGKVRLLLGSSDTVRVDFLVDALRQVKKKYGRDLTLAGIGPPGEYLRREGLDIEVHPMMDYDHFRQFLACSDDTLGVIPLEDSAFSNCKSPIKYIDYSLAGIPTVCSNVLPYRDFVAHGETGLLCANDTNAWTEAISGLVESAKKRQQLAAAARRHCMEHAGPEISGAAWQKLVETMHTVQPNRGELVSPAVHSRMHPKTLLYAWRVLRSQGLGAMFKRVRQRLSRGKNQTNAVS